MQKTSNVKYYLAASIALLTFFVYLPALRNDFVYWDDNIYIFENPYIRSFDAVFFRWAFTTTLMGNWNPVTWFSHMADMQLYGLNPTGHHLTSIILHAVNTALVVLLMGKLLEIARERFAQNSSDSLLNDRTVLITAAATGLLFGIHPVHVESVAWVAERKDLLCALFFLLSIMTYVTVAVSQGAGVGRDVGSKDWQAITSSLRPATRRYYILSLAFFILALMSKPMAVSLPVVLLILDWHLFGKIRSVRTFWNSIVKKLPYFILSLVSSIIAVIAQKTVGALSTIDKAPLSIRIPVAAKALVAYLGKMLLPVNLLPFYPYPKDVSPFAFEYIFAIGLVIGLTIACLVLVRKQKLWLSAWGYYVVTLIPVLGIIQVGGQAMADRYTYLPSLGPFLVAGVCIAWISKKVFTGKGQTGIIGGVAVTASLILVACLSYLTISQITVWRDSFSLWTTVIEKGTEKLPMAYVNRGAAFQKAGLLEKAVADYEMAVNLDPSDYRAYISLGAVLEQMGQFDRAKEAVERAIDLNPSSHEAYRNRGLIMEKMGRFDEALADYSRAIVLQPSYFEAYNSRGLLFAKMGRFDKAISDYSEAITINPRHFNAYINRGVAFTLTGQFDNALEDFNRAILLGQDDSIAYYNRGMFYRRTGKNELALSDVRKACDLGNERACSALNSMTQDGNANSAPLSRKD